MKTIIAILIFAGVLSQSFSKVFIVLSYHLNQEYITAKFCENKDKPSLKCDGQCYMKKQLVKNEQEQNNPFSKNQLEKLNITLYTESQDILIPICFKHTKKQKFAQLQDDLVLGAITSIFHPPPFRF